MHGGLPQLEAVQRQRRRSPPSGSHQRAASNSSRTAGSSAASGGGDGGGDDDGGGGDEPPPPPPRWERVDHLHEHLAAALVPEMSAVDFAALLSDIRERGILSPLEVVGDVVLDGRHRLRAACELGLSRVPVVDIVLDGRDSAEHLLRAALLRRHLTDDQRAVMAAHLARELARPRGGDRRSAEARPRPDQSGPRGQIDPTPARTEAARLVHVAPARVKKAQALLATAPELAARVHRGELTLGAALQAYARARQSAGIRQTKLPDGVFRTLVADPPWRYRDEGCRGAAEGHYPTMSVEEICALPIAQRAADQAHLYLWTTAPMLAEGLKVMSAWGFAYVTVLVWHKPRLGLGRYFRSVTEFVLFGVRGKLLLNANDIPNLFTASVGRHSEKPEAFFELVERASPGPYLELFARQTRPGWTSWGAEVESEPGIIISTPQVKSGEASP